MYDSGSSGWQTPSEKSVPNSPKYPNSSNSDSDYASSVAILGKDGNLTSRERQRRFVYNLCLYCGSSGHMISHCPKPQVRKHSNYSGSDSDSGNSGSNHNSGSFDADVKSVTSISDHHSVHSNPGSAPNSGSENSDSDPVSGYSESDSESDDSDSEDSNYVVHLRPPYTDISLYWLSIH